MIRLPSPISFWKTNRSDQNYTSSKWLILFNFVLIIAQLHNFIWCFFIILVMPFCSRLLFLNQPKTFEIEWKILMSEWKTISGLKICAGCSELELFVVCVVERSAAVKSLSSALLCWTLWGEQTQLTELINTTRPLQQDMDIYVNFPPQDAGVNRLNVK